MFVITENIIKRHVFYVYKPRVPVSILGIGIRLRFGAPTNLGFVPSKDKRLFL